MSARQFMDCDGDIWTEYEPGWLRLDSAVTQIPAGVTASVSEVRDDHGPLTEIRPDVDVRALLADVFDGLAEEALGLYWAASVRAEESVYGKLADMFGRQARELREASE